MLQSHVQREPPQKESDHANLPQINMEAHRRPYIEDSSLIKGPLSVFKKKDTELRPRSPPCLSIVWQRRLFFFGFGGLHDVSFAQDTSMEKLYRVSQKR